jgi:hypothetical protein
MADIGEPFEIIDGSLTRTSMALARDTTYRFHPHSLIHSRSFGELHLRALWYTEFLWNDHFGS